MREDIGVLFVGSLLLHKFLLAAVDKGEQINVPQHIYSADSSFFVIGKRVLKSFLLTLQCSKYSASPSLNHIGGRPAVICKVR